MNEQIQEKKALASNGMKALILITLFIIGAIKLIIISAIVLDNGTAQGGLFAVSIVLIILACFYAFIIAPILYCGIKVLKPNEALVLTLFGKYYGTLKEAGMYFVNPFCVGVNPVAKASPRQSGEQKTNIDINSLFGVSGTTLTGFSKKISLKSITLNNEKQKINDLLGTPVIIGIVVIWRVVDTAKAAFNVDNYAEYLSIQCDSALRNIVRLYPYDSSNDEENEKTLRSSGQEIAQRLKEEIQLHVEVAGLEIQEARITHLAYAPEIAAAMLQRQQAAAIIDARQMIVDGAVGMVEMALNKLNDNGIVNLDEERKANMVSNLLVVLCASKEVAPVINSGSLY
jgi:regulator of protease activity HflC (stomatin/prohibitin superfamily)